MDYITVTQLSKQWQVTPRHIQNLCKAGRIPGVKKFGRSWLIPAGTDKPGDLRSFPKEGCDRPVDFPIRSPLLNLSRLSPARDCDAGTDALAAAPEAQALFAAQLAYSRGEIDRAYEGATALLSETSCFELQVGTGLLLSLCAMYRGDLALWRRATLHIASTPCHGEEEQQRLAFWLAAADSAIYDNAGFPAAFCRGCFDLLPADSFPAARFFFVKYLYVELSDCVREMNQSGKSLVFNPLLHALPITCELLISQTRAEGVIIAEIYLRLICAIAYHNSGNNALAAEHIDRALALALPDKLYSPLAEYRQPLDTLMDERLGAIDPTALREVKALTARLMRGWAKLHNTLLNRRFSNELTAREREISRLAAFGLTNIQIAQRLFISVSTVKQTLRSAMDKTGARSRSELVGFL